MSTGALSKDGFKLVVLLGRIGYAPGHWLIYATGGLAWTHDQFTRTQIVAATDPSSLTRNPGSDDLIDKKTLLCLSVRIRRRPHRHVQKRLRKS